MANFDANEIERQANRVEEQLGVFTRKVSTIINNLEEMRELVHSTDSNLSNELRMYWETYIKLQSAITTNFKMLANTMHGYAKKTIQNEETISKDVSTANSELQNINQSIDNVGTNMGMPEIFTGWE